MNHTAADAPGARAEIALADADPQPPAPPSPGRTEPPAFTRSVVLTALALAVVFTALCLQWSLSHARLSQDPTYDDCAYLYDGGKRLLTLYERGVGAFLSETVQDPPHAPFSAFGATLAFALCGMHDWAPYALNGLLVFAFLLFVGYLGRALPDRWRGALMFLALTLPITVGMVHDFRPDAMCALCAAAGVYLAAEAGVYRSGPAQRRGLIAGGAAFGLALWAKPAVFPLTVLAAGLSAGGAWLAACLFDPSARAPRRALAVGAAVALPCALVALPYWAVGGAATVRYFLNNSSFGQDNQFTKLAGGLTHSLRFYTVGPSGAMLLGNGMIVWLILYALFLGWLVWRRHRRELALQALLLALTGVALGVVVYGRINNPFFGVTWALLLVVACLRAGAFFLSALPLDRWPGRAGAVLLAAVIATDGLALPLAKIWASYYPAVDALTGHGHSINQGILDDIGRELVRHPPPMGEERATVFLMATGFINEGTLRWMAFQQGKPLVFFDLQRAPQIQPFRDAITTAGFVVSADENAGGVFQMNPPYKIRAELAQLAADEEHAKRLRLLASYPTPDGGSYRLWINEARAGQVAGVYSPFADWEGFLPFEGPYPEYHGSRIRWATGARSEFTFNAAAAGPGALDMWMRAPAPFHAQLLLDGNPVGEVDVPVENNFQHVVLPVTLHAGANRFALVSASEPPANPDGNHRSVLFSQLEVEPAP